MATGYAVAPAALNRVMKFCMSLQLPIAVVEGPTVVERLLGDCDAAAGTLDCSSCSRMGLGSSVYDS